jgi:hypothetical protein
MGGDLGGFFAVLSGPFEVVANLPAARAADGVRAILRSFNSGDQQNAHRVLLGQVSGVRLQVSAVGIRANGIEQGVNDVQPKPDT